MDIFMKNIPYTADDIKVTLQLAPVLHSPQFELHAISPGLPINFNVHLLPDRYRRNPHSGSGILTVPSVDIGLALLKYFSDSGLIVDGRLIMLQRGKKQPRPDILGEIQLMPFRDPRAIREKEERLADFSDRVDLQAVQFAWACRDGCLSVEWDWNDRETIYSDDPPLHRLLFHEETREIYVRRSDSIYETTISIRYSRVQEVETDSRTKVILLMLETPPSFEKEDLGLFPSHLPTFLPKKKKRQKLSHIDAKHATVVPFTWGVLRLVCDSLTGLSEFKRMADLANLTVRDRHRPMERRGLFSATQQVRLEKWLSSLDWSVAFQCETLYRDMLLDTVELLGLRNSVNELVRSRGPQHASQVLRQFGLHLKNLRYFEDETTVEACFTDAKNECDQTSSLDFQTTKTNTALFQCLHVNFTPTRMRLRGPFPDTSNRILRQHKANHDAFLRVSFTDEEGLQFRFDRREVDGPQFIEQRVGTILKKGFDLCGRQWV